MATPSKALTFTTHSHQLPLSTGVHPRKTGQSIRLIQERRDAPKIPIRTRPFLGEAQT